MTAAKVEGPQWLESSGMKGTPGIRYLTVGGLNPDRPVPLPEKIGIQPHRRTKDKIRGQRKNR
jgi:hypothetical protein